MPRPVSMTRSELEEVFEDRNCCYQFTKEFKFDKICQKNLSPGRFCKCQWQKENRSWLWLIYRWLLAIAYAGLNVYSVCKYEVKNVWFIHFTNVCFFLSLILMIYAVLITSIYFINPSLLSSCGCGLYFFWIIYHTAGNLSIVVAFLHWTCTIQAHFKHPLTSFAIYLDFFNTAAMVVDQMLVAFPTRILHFIFPILFSALYLVFVGFFDGFAPFNAKEHRSVCVTIDWMDPVHGIFSCLTILLFILCASGFLFGLQKFRTWMYLKLYPRPPETEAGSQIPSSVESSSDLDGFRFQRSLSMVS